MHELTLEEIYKSSKSLVKDQCELNLITHKKLNKKDNYLSRVRHSASQKGEMARIDRHAVLIHA